MVGRLLCVVSVLALTSVWPTDALAQDQAYKDGLDARGNKKWAEMADAMRRAIASDGKESTRKVRTGVRFFGGATEYMPHYFLGEALRNLGDCAGAIAAWETSEDHKVVLARPELAANIRVGYKECAAKGVLLRGDFGPQIAGADETYRKVYDQAQALTTLKDRHPTLWTANIEAEYERARHELDTAHTRLTKARQTRLASDVNKSKEAAAEAGMLLSPIEATLNAAISGIASARGRYSEVQQLIAGAEETDRAITAVKITLTSSLAATRETARQDLVRARERLGNGDTPTPAALNEAQNLVKGAATALTIVFGEAKKLTRGLTEQQFQVVLSAADREFAFVQASLQSVGRLFANKSDLVRPDMMSLRETLTRDVSAARRSLERARRSESIPAVQDAARVALDARMRLDSLIKALGPATLRDRGVAPGLEAGARHYLAGEYQEAVEALRSISDNPLQAHVHLFRAASFYGLYLTSREANVSARAEALAEIQRCKAIDPQFQPSPRAFTPRFITFFHTVGAQSEDANPAPRP